jgi:hypothetical protein
MRTPANGFGVDFSSQFSVAQPQIGEEFGRITIGVGRQNFAWEVTREFPPVPLRLSKHGFRFVAKLDANLPSIPKSSRSEISPK